MNALIYISITLALLGFVVMMFLPSTVKFSRFTYSFLWFFVWVAIGTIAAIIKG